MFSMFGRTGDPTKRGPTRRPANFDEQKKVVSFSGRINRGDTGELTADRR